MKSVFNVVGGIFYFSLAWSTLSSNIQHNPIFVQCRADLDCQFIKTLHESELIFNNIVE